MSKVEQLRNSLMKEQSHDRRDLILERANVVIVTIHEFISI